jgi:predicted RNA-binding protein associated with RNAse of E/G family
LSGAPAQIRIRYHRPAHGTQEFVQHLVTRTATCVITLHDATPIDAPLVVDDVAILEPGAPAVWFSFHDAWHDIARFHDVRGDFTGVYANVLTPVHGLDGDRWATTDLCLDIWLPAGGGTARLLDRHELDAAMAGGHISTALGARAHLEATTLLQRSAHGAWPPAIVEEWPLSRARAAVARAGTAHDG